MPEMPDVVSGEIIESEWANDIRDRTIQRYANVAERTSLNATPTVGDFSFLEDSGQVDVYYSGAWRPIDKDPLINQVTATGAITTSNTALISVNLTIPASWATATITAWGGIHWGPASNVAAHITIGGNAGTEFNSVGVVGHLSLGHRRTALTPGLVTCQLIARRSADATNHQSVLTASMVRTA